MTIEKNSDMVNSQHNTIIYFINYLKLCVDPGFMFVKF